MAKISKCTEAIACAHRTAPPHQHRHQRTGPRAPSPTACQQAAGRHLHAVPDDAQLPLERHRADVQHAAPDVHGAVHRAVERGRPDRRAHPLAGLSGAGLLRAVRRAQPRSRTCPPTPPKALEMVRILVEGHEAVARTARGIFPLADKAERRADRRPADAAPHGARADGLDAAQPARRVSAVLAPLPGPTAACAWPWSPSTASTSSTRSSPSAC